MASSEKPLPSCRAVPRRLLVGALLLLLAAGPARAGEADPPSSAAALYATHCASCHGDTGAGDGPAAWLVNPRPRDFTRALYRLRSTPSGQLPTDADIARSIRVGLPGTPMTGFEGILSDAEIAALVEQVKGFSPRFADPAEHREPVALPAAAPALTDERAARGREVYRALGCIECHGETGKGDGPQGHLMRDERGFPIPPKDLAAGIFKSGPRPEDLYRTILTGLNGTAMPAYGDLLKPESGVVGEGADWDLIAYLYSLGAARRGAPGQTAGARLAVRPVDSEEMFASPLAPGWDDVAGTEVNLWPLWSRGEFTSSLTVRAAGDARRVALLLEWDDATHDLSSAGLAEFPDQAAVAFPTGSGLTFLGMGMANPDGTPARDGLMNIWSWRADSEPRRAAGEPGGPGELGARHPLGTVDFYPFRSGWVPGDTRPMLGDSAAEHHPGYLTGWAAGNPLSDPASPKGRLTEYVAAGFGTLTPQPPDHQHVSGGGAWRVGRWRALFVRDRASGGDQDVALTGRASVPVSFAIWDGSHRDRNGMKSVSYWHHLVLESSQEVRP